MSYKRQIHNRNLKNSSTLNQSPCSETTQDRKVTVINTNEENNDSFINKFNKINVTYASENGYQLFGDAEDTYCYAYRWVFKNK